MPAAEFIGKFRLGKVLREIPTELIQRGATLEEALKFSKKVKEFLVDGRFAE
jgi:hypothetical protein